MSISSVIIDGNLAELEYLLKTQTTINEIDEYGFTPLIQTAIVNNAAMAKLLLEHGADPLQQDLTGGTALHWAVDNNNAPLCQLLLEYGANVNAYTAAGEPVGVKPVLRKQLSLRRLLSQHGMNLDFINDYIHTKLLGHRFELRGYVDIVNADGYFVEIDLEGFFLEFTLDIIYHSLADFHKNFLTKYFTTYSPVVKQLLKVFYIARQLIKYEHYQINTAHHQKQIETLLSNPILLLPISYEGHAITMIKCAYLLGKCDRSINEKFKENVLIYEIGDVRRFNTDFMKNLMYSRQSQIFIDEKLPKLCNLQRVLEMPLGAQITGNCSWANVEAAIPVILFFTCLMSHTATAPALMHQSSQKLLNWFNLENKYINNFYKFSIFFYQQWREWDKERALSYLLQTFPAANPARKASIAALLAALLFQRCSADHAPDIARAQKIVPILKTPGYEYILESYIEIYCHQNQTQAGKNLQRLLTIVEQLT